MLTVQGEYMNQRTPLFTVVLPPPLLMPGAPDEVHAGVYCVGLVPATAFQPMPGASEGTIHSSWCAVPSAEPTVMFCEASKPVALMMARSPFSDSVELLPQVSGPGHPLITSSWAPDHDPFRKLIASLQAVAPVKTRFVHPVQALSAVAELPICGSCSR